MALKVLKLVFRLMLSLTCLKGNLSLVELSATSLDKICERSSLTTRCCEIKFLTGSQM